jgi:hypothetical protein
MRFRLRIGVLATILAFGMLIVQAVHATNSPSTATPLEISLSTSVSEIWEGDRLEWQVSLKNVSELVLSEVTLSPAGQAWFWPEGPLTTGALSAGQGIVVEVPVVPLQDGDVWPALVATWKVEETGYSLLVSADHSLRVRPVREAVEGQVLLQRGTVYRGEHLPLQVWIANHSPFPLTGMTVVGQGTDLKWDGISAGEDVPAGETTTISLSPQVDGDNPQAVLALEFDWIDAADRKASARILLESDSVQIKRRVPIDIPWSAVTAIVGFLLGWLTWWLQHRQEQKEARQINCERALGMLSLIQVQAWHGADEGTEIGLDLVQKLFSEEGLYAALERLATRASGLKDCVHDIWRATHEHNVSIHCPDGARRTQVLRDKSKQLDAILRDLKCEE